MIEIHFDLGAGGSCNESVVLSMMTGALRVLEVDSRGRGS